MRYDSLISTWRVTQGWWTLIRCFFQTYASTGKWISELKSWDNGDMVKAIRAYIQGNVLSYSFFPRSIMCEYVNSNSDLSQAIRSVSQLFHQNTIKNSFSVVKEAVGKIVLKSFMKRHSDNLSLRRQPTANCAAIARARGFSRQECAESENEGFIWMWLISVEQSGYDAWR
jgi:hypothetical protein